MGIGFQAQFVLALVDLLGIVPVDHVGGAPVGVRLGEAAYGWVVVPGAEVIGAGFGIQILSAVTEGIAVQRVRVLFIAEGVVVVGVADGTVGIAGCDYIAVGIEKVILHFAVGLPADEVDTTQVVIRDSVILDFRHDVAAVQEEGCSEIIYPFRRADTLGVVGIGHGDAVYGQANERASRYYLIADDICSTILMRPQIETNVCFFSAATSPLQNSIQVHPATSTSLPMQIQFLWES